MGLKDYHPVALASIIVKYFERLIKDIIVSSLSPAFDSHIFNLYCSRHWSHCVLRWQLICGAKKSTIMGLKDYHPVALASIIVKYFERLIKDIIVSSLSPAFDSRLLLSKSAL
ncbi:hypothetical protein E2320_019312 [Naja naja]|nr:hypothetical protein E2320_019312 [Naja naja]